MRQSDPDSHALQIFLSLNSPEDVARVLGTNIKFLRYLVFVCDSAKLYSRFEILKNTGGMRVISAPIHPLKCIQSRLASLLTGAYRPKSSVHGFIEGRSILTNARLHVGRRYVLNIDLKDFFPSIHFGRVRGLFWVGAVQTVPDVTIDEKAFETAQRTKRTTIALEMEGIGIAKAARTLRLDGWMLAKGVQDHAMAAPGLKDKVDDYRQFAAYASARFTIEFLRHFLPPKK